MRCNKTGIGTVHKERTAEGKKRLNGDQEENLHDISKFLKAKFADFN